MKNRFSLRSKTRRQIAKTAKSTVCGFVCFGMFFTGPVNPLQAADYYWDSDATAAGNNVNGTGLGGSGTWNTSLANWWDLTNDVVWPNAFDTSVFTGTAGTVTLGTSVQAGGLTFKVGGYSIVPTASETLTLVAPSGSNSPIILVEGLGTSATIGAILAGTSGFTKTGNGTLRLTNSANTFTGDLAIKGGNLIVNSAGALGAGTTAISVTGIANRGNPGFSGGTLVLGGTATNALSGFTLNREVSASGRGPGAANESSAVTSVGYNTFSGGLTLGSAASEGRAVSSHGITTVSGGLYLGSGAANILTGNGNWVVSGVVSGSDTAGDRFIKSGTTVGSTLWLQNANNTFAQPIRVDSGSLRVTANGALGLNAGTGAVDLNNGTFEARTDAASGFAGRSLRVRNNTTGTVFVDHDISGGLGIGTSLQNQTVTMGSLIRDAGANGATFTFNGRNGYGISFASALPGAGDHRGVTINNNTSGTVTLTGNVWNANNATASTYTVQGGGETEITGRIITTAVANALAKGGSGTFTLSQGQTGSASTFLGDTTISDGTLAIRSIKALNDTSTRRIILGGGALSFLGDTGTGAGETWSAKTFDLNATAAYVLANQSGSAPTALVLPNNWGATNTAAKTLNLGGSSPSNVINEVNGLITNSGNLTNVQKFGSGTWELSAPTSYGTANPAFSITAIGATAGSTVTTTSTTGLVVGQPISGTGFAFGTVITAIISPTQFTISKNASNTGTSVVLGAANGATAALTTTAASTGTTANPILTVASTSNLVPGQQVTHASLPANQNWYIRDITSATTVTLVSGIGSTMTVGAIASGQSVTPTASPNFGGNLTVTNGLLRLDSSSGASNIVNDTSNLIFTNDSVTNMGNAGGTLEYVGSALASSTEVLGRLNPAAGHGIIKITNGTGADTLTFLDLSRTAGGATLDLQPGTGTVGFTTAPTLTNGILPGYATFNGVDFVTLSGNNAAAYGAATAWSGALSPTSTVNYLISGTASSTGGAVNSLKLTGGADLTLGAALPITTNPGGVLFDNSSGTASITGAFQLGTAAQELLVTTNGSSPATAPDQGDELVTGNALSIGSSTSNTVISSGTGSLTKAGNGTLILFGGNAYTGNTVINQGAIQLSGAAARLGTISTATNITTIRQAGILDINAAGASAPLYSGGTNYPETTIGSLSGGGMVTNSGGGANTQATLNIGLLGTTTSSATFSGALQDGGGILNVTKNGTGTQAIVGPKTYTGITTINAGTLAVTHLGDGNSGLGNSSNAASNLIFGGGTLLYTGASASGAGIYQTTQTPSVTTSRLFSLAGNAIIQSSGTYGNESGAAGTGANNASLIFSATAAPTFLTGGAKTITLGGTSTSDNEFRLNLIDNTIDSTATALTKADASLWILNPTASNTYTGITTISGGSLRVASAASTIQGLSANSPLVINGGVLETSGSFTRNLGAPVAGTGTVQLPGGASGFAAATPERLVVTLGGGAVTWGGNFNPSSLVLGSATALGETEIANNIILGTSARTVTVNNNANTGTMVTAGILSGVISGGAGGTLTKNGGGALILGNANTYVANTILNNGSLFVTSIGNATGTVSSSLGASGGTFNFGSGTATVSLHYVGAGESASRPFSITSGASTQRIDSSGNGALVLNGAFSNTATGAVTLELRGTNTDGNMLANTTALSNSGANVLTVTKTDGGVWILNPSVPNTFTGNINAGLGMLGLTQNGIGGAGAIAINNGGIFAYGGPLTTTTVVQGNNSTGIFGGSNSITINRPGLTAIQKTAGNNQWTISNNLEGGALLTVNGNFTNLEAGTAAATQTITIAGYGSTVWNGAITENAAAGGKIAWAIAIHPEASFTTSGAANTYSGTTTVTNGILILDKTTTPLGTGTFAFNGGTLRVGSTPANLSGANAITNPVALNASPPKIDGAKSIEFSGAVTMGASRNLQNELTGGANLIFSGTVTNTAASTLTIYGSGNTQITGNVTTGTGAQGLQLSGNGTLLLTGTNLATGALTASRSTITLSGTSGGSWNAGTAAVNPGGTLVLDNSGGNNPAGRLNDTGAFTGNGGTLHFINDGTASSETMGALTLNSSTTSITMAGSGTGALTFASANFVNTGSSLDLSTITGLGTNNKVLVTAALPANALINGILPRTFINGGADFAEYDATDGVRAFSSYVSNINTATSTETVELTANAATTANRAVNAIKLDHATGITISGAASNRLTLTAAGILNAGGNNTLSVNEIAFGATTGYLQVAPSTTLNLSSGLTGSTGLAKALSGTLAFSSGARSFVTSTHNLLGGTTILNGGADTFFPNQGLVVNSGATLNLNGGGLYANSLSSPGALPDSGGTINGGGAIVTNLGGSVNFAGKIQSGTSFGRAGGNTLTLASAHSYTGTTVLMGGTTTLENDATLLNTSSIAINAATLTLSNNTGLQTQINDRIGNGIPISMNGGSISYTGRISTAATETFGALTLSQGANSVSIATGGGTFTSAAITFASLTRNAGTTLNFGGSTIGQQGNNTSIVFTAPLTAVGSGALGAWAIANSNDYAAYNTALGVGIVGQGGFTGYDGTFASGNLTELQSTAAITRTLGAGTTTTSLLKFAGGFTNSLEFANGVDTLHLELGGILRSNNNNATTIGTVAARGVITSGVSELVVFNQANTTGATAMTINSLIQGAGTTLVKSGAGVLALTGVNTYGGGTYVSQGTLELRGTNTGDVVIPAGGLILTNSIVTMFATAGTNPVGQGQIHNSNAVTLNGSSTLTAVGNNTLSSLTFNNNGGTTNPTVTSGGLLTLSHATPITVTSSNPATVATVAGNLDLGSGTKTINTPAIQVGGVTVTNLVPSLNISANILSPGMTLTKTGGGLLQLGGQNTFTGGVNLNAGGIVIGASSSPAQGGAGITSGPLGSGTLTVASGAKILTSGSFGLANDISFSGTPSFDSTANTAWTLSLGGTLNGAGLASATPTIEITNPGLTVALLGNISNIASITGFNKTGLGTLVFNAKDYTGNFDAAALGNPLAVSLLHDGNSPNTGNGVVETISLPGTITFAGNGTGTVTVNRAGGSLYFNQGANKIIAPASINTVLTNGLIVANTNGYGLQVSDSGAFVGTPAYTVNTATASNVTQGLYFTGDLSGSGFVKTGAGTLVLNNATPANNTFTGNVNINQGVVSVNTDAQLGNSANLVLLNPQSGTATFRATDSFTMTRAIQLSNTTNSRAIEVVGDETLTLGTAFDLNAGAGATASLIKADNGTVVVNASNPGWSGALNINAGAVLVNNNTLTSPLGTGTIFISPGAAVVGAALQLAGGVTINNPINLQNTGNRLDGGINFGGMLESVSGNNTYAGAIASPWDATIGARAGSTLDITGGIVYSGTHLLQFNSEGTINIKTTAVTGAAWGLDKFGSGTMTISVATPNLTGGGFKVRNGLMILDAAGTTNSSGGPNIVYQGATLRLDNTATNTNNRLTARAVTLQGGTFDFLSNNSTETAGAFVSDQGANTINLGGTGTAALTFSTYTGNAGSSLNVTGTFGTATNFVKFTTAPALTPVTTGILNRVTVNGNQLASYNATNGIVAFTGYSPATNILSAGATQVFNATPLTANSLTGNQTLNALTLSSGAGSVNVGGLSGLNPTTLTLTSGTILANGTGTSSTLSVPVVAFAAAEAVVHVASGQTLNVTSGFSGTGGLSKNLPGTLSFDAPQFISGTTYVNNGTLSLNSGGVNTLLFNNGLAVNGTGVVNLNGKSQFIAGLSSASAGGSSGVGGGTVTNSGAQAVLTVNGNTNFGGLISGNIFLNKTGTSALNLQKAQTYTGPTLITGGTLTLNDYGTLPNTTQPIEIRYGTLTLANGNLTNVNNRVNDLAPISLSGGTISYAGRAQMDTSETLGAVTLTQGNNSIFADDGNAGLGSAVLTLASITQANTDATLRFNNLGDFGLIGTRGRVMITANPALTNNIIGPWAIVDREYASYDATYGVGGLNTVGYAGYAGSGLNTNPLVTDNVRFTTTGTTLLAGNTTVNTLNFASQNAATVLDLNGNTLTLRGGGLLLGQSTDNVNFSITNGTITSGVLNSPSNFFLTQANYGGTNRTVTIGAVIADNGTGAVRLIKSGGQNDGVTTLNGVNSYTGGTVVNSGTLTIGSTGALGSGGITVNQATLTQTAGGGIGTQSLTMNGGSVVTLANQANTLTGLTFNNNGGAAPTLNPTGTLTLTGGITSDPTNAGTIATVTNGTLDLNGAGSYSVNVAATLVNSVDVAPWQAGLIINSAIQNGGIVKTGAGVLQLGGASTFAGGLTVNAGGLIIATDTNSLILNDPVTTGPVGTGTLTMGANTTLLAGGAARTITNNVTFLGDAVFNGTNNLTLNGITTLPSIWNATVTAPQMTVTIGDASPSIGTDVINKSGLGILTVGNYAGTINASGGLLFADDGNTLGTPENVSLGGNLVITGDTAITVNRTGSGPNSRNKLLQKVDLTIPGNIMSISNQSGYGLEFTGTTLMTGPAHFAVGVATASNVVQGLTLSGVVDDGASTFGIIKSGPGTLVLSGTNTFGGVGQTIDILNGIVAANSDAALGDAGNTVTLNADGSTGLGFRATGTFSSGRTFLLSQANNAFEVTTGNLLTLTSPFTLSAASNTLTKNDNGVLVLNANNTGWTGAVTVNAGAIRVGHANALGSGTVTVNNATSSGLQLAGVSFANPVIVTATGASGFDTRGVIEAVSGTNTFTGLITQNTGVAAVYGAASGTTLNINGNIAASNSATFHAAGTGIINLNSVYGNGGAGGPTLTKLGTGTLNVTVGQPSVTSAITINQGTMSVSGSGVGIGITGLVSVNASGTLNIDDSVGAPSAHFGGRALTIQGGSFSYTGNTANSAETLGALTFSRMGGVFTSNQTGAGTVSLTFASLALGADATANFAGTNLGTATNKLLFTTAPTLTPATTGILSRATVNGADFATYGANGIAAFSAYQTSNNPNTAAATDTMNLTADANLTATKTLNAIKINGASPVALGGAAFNQLVLTAGGILATGGATHTLSVPVLNNAAVQNLFHVDTGSTLNVTSTIVGSAGLVKDGAGTLILSPTNFGGVSHNTFTGTVTVARGTLQLAGGTNTLTPNQFLVMGGPSATLDLKGTSQQISGLLTDTTTPGSGGIITSSFGTGQLVINADNTARTWAGSINGSVNLVRSGQNTLSFASGNAYTGTTILNGGTTTLRDDGTLSGTSAISVNYATLSLDNNVGFSGLLNRINDSAPITLRGGTLNFQGRAQSASTETLGAVTLAQGTSFINSVVGGTGLNSADLTLTSLTRAVGGGTVNFTAATGGLIGSSSRILIPTINGISTATAFNALNDGILGGWAVIGTSDWASYIPGLGVGAMGQQGFPQYANIVTTPTTLGNAAATDNVNLNTASITSLVNDDVTVNSLRLGNVASNTVNIAASKTLTLESGGLLFFTNQVHTIGAAVNQGNLTSGGSELFAYTQGSATSVINSVVSGAVSFVKYGSGSLSLAGTNTYTGGTTVNQGTLTIAATGNIPLATTPANGLILNNGTVTLNAAGAIAAGNIVTINSAGSTLNLFGNNTLEGLVLNNTGGGSGNLQVNTFSTSTATGAGSNGVLSIGSSGIVATSANVSSNTIIVGRVDFGATAKTIDVAPITTNGVAVSPLQSALLLQGIVGTDGGITKSGNGVLQFNAQAHYSGPTTVNAGGIRIGVTNGGSRLSGLTLNGATTSLNLAGVGTTWGSLAGSGIVFNSGAAATLTVGFDNSDTTFSGQFARFNDAVINGVALQKVGTGTMTMTSAQSAATGTTGAITVQGGTLRYTGAGAAFPGTTGAGGSGGVTFTVNSNGILALDNATTSNVNNRLGLNAVGTLNLQGGKLTINGNSTASTPTSEGVTAFNVTNGGGRIELSADPSNPLTLAVTTLGGQNNAGTLVVTGITGAASGNGVANLTITTPTLIGGQGGGANGTATMSVRSDILADPTVSGLGVGFLVKDSVTNNYRALGFSSAGSPVAGEFESAANTATLINWGATENVKVSSAQTIFANTPANTLTFEGTSGISSGLGAAFGSFGPGGAVLTQNLSNAAGLLVLDGATATIGTGGFAGTTAGTTMNFHVVGSGALNIAGAFGIGNTGGIIKSDGGTMSLNNRAYFTGVTTINNGTLRLNSGTTNTLAVIPTAGAATVSQVNLHGSSSVLDLMGRSQAIGVITSVNPLPGSGGTVQNTGAAATLTSIGTGTFSGSIVGNLALTRAGNTTTTLTNSNTYTGTTIVRGGVLELRDSGSLASTAGLTLNYGTLNWNNAGLNPNGTPNPVRIAANNAVTMQGGTFTINGAGSTDTVVTLNSVTVTGGSNFINTLPIVNQGSTVKLTIGNLVRNAATRSGVVFNGFTSSTNTLGGQGLSANSNVFLTQVNGTAFSATNLVNNLIGGWAVADGSTFATYSNTFGVVAMGNSYGGFSAPAFTGTDLTSTVATGNYNDAGTGTTAITRTMTTGAKTANSWRIAQTGAATTITPVAGTTYSFGVGVITNNNQTVTIGAVDSSNTITGTAADLYFFINQGTTIVQPAIIGSSSLISNGPGTLSLRPQFANNTYSGGTFVNAGTLNLQAAATFIAIPGALTITNGAVTMSTTPNQIAATSAVTINGGGSLTFANYTSAVTTTLASLTFNNAGGTANPTVALGTPTTGNSHTLILTGATPITSTNDSLATTPTISTGSATLTGLQFSDANPVLTVNDGLAETELHISAPITQNVNMLSLSKSGAGLLALSGASTFTTGFSLNQGSLMFGAGSTGTVPTITAGPVGTGTLTIGNGTSLLSDGTARTIGNATTVNGDFTFAGRTAGNNLILSGAMDLGATGRTITVDSPAVTGTISGPITSTATGTALTKAGNGTLVLSSATSNLGGAGVTIAGGILKNGIANALPNGSLLTVNSGAGYDLNDFSQIIQQIAGTGFITNSANTTDTLTVGGTSATDTTSAVSFSFGGVLTDNRLAQASSALALTKAGSGTLTLTGTFNNHYGATTVVAGTLLGGATNTFSPNSTVIVGNSATAAGAVTATFDTGAFNQTIGGLSATTNTVAGSSVINIPSTRTLTVNGPVLLGSNTAATDVTTVNFTGGGALVLNGTSFQVGGGTAANANAATVNMTALASLTANLGATGTFRVGDVSTATVTLASTLTLPTTSTITANIIGVGDNTGGGGATQTLELGSGLTTLNANTINIGSGPTGGGARGVGSLIFDGATGTLTVRSQADPVNGRSNLNLANTTFSTGGTTAGTFDTTGHSADLRFNTMVLAARSANTGGATAIFSFDTGTLDANDLIVGNKAVGSTATTAAVAGTLNLGGGNVDFNATTSAIQLGINATSTGTGSGTMNVTGGTVDIAANAGISIIMGNASVVGGTASGALNLLGGTTTLAGHLVRGTATGTSTASLNLDGGTLDMGNQNIGGTVAGQNLTSLTFASGTLRNVGEINNGAALNKTTAGVLVLNTANSYTGATNVNAGVLQVKHGGALGGTTNGTTVSSGAVLELSNDVTVTGELLTLNGTGVSNGGALLNVSGDNTYAGNITLASASSIQSDSGLLTIDVASGSAVSGSFDLTFGGAGDIVVSDAISIGSANLIKNGAGLLTFNGDNNYTGTTTVNDGGLIVNGDQSAATGDVTISSTAYLGGAGGTVGGHTTIDGSLSTGLDPLALGDVGNLDFNGKNVTFGSGSAWFIDLVQGSNSSDSISGVGLLTIDPTATLTFYDNNNFTLYEQFTLASYSNLALGSAFMGYTDNTVYTIGGGQYLFSYGTGTNSAITLTAVPEPGTLGLLGLALGGFFLRRLRKRRMEFTVTDETRD